MKPKTYRRAIFIVTYARTKQGIKYLILKRKLHWVGWEFPKGGKRIYETNKRTVKRELKEETGLKVLKIKKFDFSGKYKYDKAYKGREKFIGQSFSLYAVEVDKRKVKIDNEHSDYKWEGFREAVKKLKWDNQKKSLRIVNKWLLSD
ncbi:MAG: NUDIX domain-containing protein [archaeon]